MKVLLVTMYFPPSGGGGVQRPLKFATHLPAHGIETHVLAPDDAKWIHSDPDLVPPTQAWIHRARYLGPRSRKLADELHGRQGLDRLSRQARSLSRRVLVPDENVGDQIMAALVLQDNAELTPDDFRQFLAAQPDLSPKAWPRHVWIIDDLPSTATTWPATCAPRSCAAFATPAATRSERQCRSTSSTPTPTRSG